MNELVSIIMPSYNTEKFIGESIRSVINQTYMNWELIIVDDCSTDNTDAIVEAFSDPRIIYVKNEKNSGAAASRNKALRMAKGKWIAFLDSDDIWLPEKLEKQITFMQENGYHFSYTAYELIDEASEKLGIRLSGPSKITKRGMYNFCWPGCLTVMYDAEKVGCIQIEDLKKNNDYAMWLKIIRHCPCYFLPEQLGLYRMRRNSISRHSKFVLIKYHYLLYRDGEKRGVLASFLLTFRNLVWGVYKKIRYVERNI